MNIFLAIVLGALFGAVLDRVGATNPNKIINMLRLTDLSLMKIILGAIGIASVGLFSGLELGFIDVGHLSVKSAYVGVIVGGALLGLGFAIAGYCPGTGLTALATGRKDALYFTLGGLLGAFLFMVTFGYIKDGFLFDKIEGGSVTLGLIEGSKYEAVFAGVSGSTLGLGLGVAFILIALLLPHKLCK